MGEPTGVRSSVIPSGILRDEPPFGRVEACFISGIILIKEKEWGDARAHGTCLTHFAHIHSTSNDTHKINT